MSPVSVIDHGRVARILVASPPVNALGHAVRVGLLRAVEDLPDTVEAFVIAGAIRTFSAGADISEFGRPLEEPLLDAVQRAIETSGKVSVAAIEGAALGGGLELALTCNYRVSNASAKLGLPEVTLGIIPGAGGTQRLPRVVGVERALELITSGNTVGAEEAAAIGLVDEIVSGDVADAAAAFAERALDNGGPHTLVRDRPVDADDELFARWRERVGAAAAPCVAVDAVEAATRESFDDGMATERRLVLDLLARPESRARQYFFFAERAAAKVEDLSAAVQPLRIDTAAVVGAGLMGGGIAMCLVAAGIPVLLIDEGESQLEARLTSIRKTWESHAARGRISTEHVEQRMATITTSTDLAAVTGVDLVVEAVFEQMALKTRVFEQLDRHAKPGAILATNTSTLDIDQIAAATSRPERVIGLHFFSPAHVMRLLEVVRGERTSDEVISTAMTLAKRIRKVAVLVRVCDGFVGNRMILVREAEAMRLLLEGATPQQVDRVLREFGFPMGSFEMQDMSGGIELLYRLRQERGTTDPLADRLAERGRLGVKAGRGFYRYDDGGRTPHPDPEVDEIAAEAAAAEGVQRRSVSDTEILERLLYPLVNEGAKILDEGIASRAGDIDVVYVYGYGWPVERGGPMYWADQVGLDVVRDGLRRLEAERGAAFAPAALLERLATDGGSFTKAL